MDWLELSVAADPEAMESLSELFARFVSGGITIDEPYTLSNDGQSYAITPGAPVTVHAYLPLDETAAEKQQQIEEGLWYLARIGPASIGELHVRTLKEEDWANAWKEHYHVLHLGARIVIKPSWREYAPQPGEIVLELDPGMAFGTGLHPTTRMCLIALEEFIRPGMRVLDVGTGSGILAIAAAKLGAAHIDALDVSSVAVDVARANAAANGVGDRVQVSLGSLDPQRAATGYDLVVANIIARTIADLAPQLVVALAPGAPLIAGGIIGGRVDEPALALAAAGLVDLTMRQEGDWVTLIGRCPNRSDSAAKADLTRPTDHAPLTEEQLRAVTVGELKPLSGQILIVDYDPDWPQLFAAEAGNIRAALGERARQIEHIGSTAVPGLAAKPIIDILLVVEDPADEASYIPALEKIGYVLRIREPEFFEHRMLRGTNPDVNLHVFPPGCQEIDRYLILRDWLRSNAADRALYMRTKRELSQRDWKYVQNYADAKTEVVEAIIARALAHQTGR
jgi:ribosomal protein L11 methyltransferase